MTDDLTPEPIEPAPVQHITKGPRRAPLLAVLVLLVVGGLAAAVLVVRSTGGSDAEEALAAARSAVADATSFRVTVRTDELAVEGDTESGSETTTHSTARGEWSDGLWHVVTDDGFYASEWITGPDGAFYSREADEEGAEIPPDAQWDRFVIPGGFGRTELTEMAPEMVGPLEGEDLGAYEDGIADVMATGFAAMLYLSGEGVAATGDPTGMGMGLGIGFGVGGEPTAFLDAIKEMGEPQLDDPDTLTATLHAGADLNDAFGQPLPDGHVEVDLGPDDLPTAVRLQVEAGRASQTIELTFSDWNTPIEVAVPGDDEVDATPWVEEEELQALPFAPVLPTAVPDGWETTLIEVMSGREYYGDEEAPEDCQLLEIDYDEPVPDDADDEAYADSGYVWLYETTLDCAMAVDSTPFAPGGPAGLASRTGTFGTTEVLVGDTAIEVDSTLEGAELDAVAASLAPTDVDAVVTAAAALGEDWEG